MYRKVITMTAYRRPEYTKQVIENLKKCIGFEEYILLPTIEPGYQEILKSFDNLSNCEIIINDTILGCATNTLKALQRGFDLSDFVIHIEDDTVPGIDTLKYFEWAYNTYKDDKDIFTVTAYNRFRDKNLTNNQNHFTTYRRPWFTGWIWGTWLEKFEEMSKNWNFIAWDVNINKRIRGKRYEICPTIPRSHNIGEHLGTYTRPDHWKKYQHNPFWINDISNLDTKNLDMKYTEISAPVNEPIILEMSQLEINQLIAAGVLLGSLYIIYRNIKK